MNDRESVAIVVPTFNGAKEVSRLLDAIAAQEGRFRPSVIAIDSGSADGTVSILQSRGVRVLPVGAGRFNHGVARNCALESVATPFAVLMVQDAVPVGPHWLEALVTPLLEDASLAGTWARQLAHEEASLIARYYHSRWMGSATAPRIAGPLTSAAFEALPPADRHAVCAFDNVCSCIRMSVWREHPFPPTRIAEDLEWARGVLQAGHRLAFVPAAQVVHSHDRSPMYELRRTYLVHQRLQAMFGLSTIPDARALAAAIALTMPMHLRLAAGERRGRIRAVVRAASLAVAFPLGQYLGARSAREGREFLRARGV